MAGYHGATARIASFVGKHPARQTPGTLSAYHDREWGTVIQSYQLPIAALVSNGDTFLVKAHRDSTPTTNRHIGAAHNVATSGYNVGWDDPVEGLHFVKTGHTQWKGDTFVVYERQYLKGG